MNPHRPAEKITDPQIALNYLKEGNARYLAGNLLPRDTYDDDREELIHGQYPFAVILTCSDSRVSPEIYFDQRLGDLFVERNAGNVADPISLGSIEYAVEHLKTPLIVVVGHSCCGAVTAAFEGGAFSPNVQAIIDLIQPACDCGDDLDETIHHHIEGMVKKVSENEVVQLSNTKVVGAYYDIHSGEVKWL